MRASLIANSFFGLWFRWRGIRYDRGCCLSLHLCRRDMLLGEPSWITHSILDNLDNQKLHFDIARGICGSKPCSHHHLVLMRFIIPQLSPPVSVAPTRCIPQGLPERQLPTCSKPVVPPPPPHQRSPSNPLRPTPHSLLPARITSPFCDDRG